MGDRLGIPRALSIFAFKDFYYFLTGLNLEPFPIDLDERLLLVVRNYLSLIFRQKQF
jgi:hypothetical protein